MSSTPSTLAIDAWGAFTGEEENRIQELLSKGLPKEFVKQRAGAGGRKIDYIEGGAQLEIANHVFGALNWSSRVVHLDVDYCRQDTSSYWHCGASSLVRVQVKSGALHEDVGYGVSKDRDQGEALERAKKAAVTDARKRALRCFGELLGNSLKHKDDHSVQLQENLEVQLQGSPSGKGGVKPASSSSSSLPTGSARPPQRALSPPRGAHSTPAPSMAPPAALGMPLQPVMQSPMAQTQMGQPALPPPAHKPPAPLTRQQLAQQQQQVYMQQQQLKQQQQQQQQPLPQQQQQQSGAWTVGGRVPMAPPGVTAMAAASPRATGPLAPTYPAPRHSGGTMGAVATSPAEPGFDYSMDFSAHPTYVPCAPGCVPQTFSSSLRFVSSLFLFVLSGVAPWAALTTKSTSACLSSPRWTLPRRPRTRKPVATNVNVWPDVG
jgi:DNA repair and recombination protein RAD52